MRLFDLLTPEEITLIPIKIDLDKEFYDLTVRELDVLFPYINFEKKSICNNLTGVVLEELCARIIKLTKE